MFVAGPATTMVKNFKSTYLGLSTKAKSHMENQFISVFYDFLTPFGGAFMASSSAFASSAKLPAFAAFTRDWTESALSWLTFFLDTFTLCSVVL